MTSGDARRDPDVDGDTIFAALEAFHDAKQAHIISLLELDRGRGLPCTPLTKASFAWWLYQLTDLEAAEAESLSALLKAESAVLATMPTTITGSAAFLGYLRAHLIRVPGMELVVLAISNVETVLRNLE